MARKTTKKSDSQTTAEKRLKFLCLLSETGNVTESAKKSGLNRQFLYDFRESHQDFAAAWDKCIKRAGGKLKEEALRRAVKGIMEPVYYKGKKVGSIRKYSDPLLTLLIKGAFPDEYADRAKTEVKNTEPIIIRWMPPPELAPAVAPENAATGTKEDVAKEESATAEV